MCAPLHGCVPRLPHPPHAAAPVHRAASPAGARVRASLPGPERPQARRGRPRGRAWYNIDQGGMCIDMGRLQEHSFARED